MPHETTRFADSLPERTATRYRQTVERTLVEMHRERAGTPALLSGASLIDTASADPRRHLDAALTMLTEAAARSMETNVGVGSDPRVDPATRLAAEHAAVTAFDGALPGYAAADRARRAAALVERRAALEERLAAVPSSQRDYVASLALFASEPLADSTAKHVHDALLARDA